MNKRQSKRLSVIMCLVFCLTMLNIGAVFADEPYVEKTYTTTTDFNLGTINNVVTTNDEVKLDDATHPQSIIWIAVSSKGTIVKIDTKSGTVLGEYWTSPDGQPKNPSRTTVDKNGSVWVANRNGHSVTRVCTPESGLWIDRNGNGVCDTSLGLGDVKPWPGGDANTAQDECIINYVLVSSTGTRHVSVDANNDVWVSGTGNRIFNLIDGTTGAIKRTEGPFGAGGYGGLIDKHNVIWSETSNNLLRWDTTSPTAAFLGTNYGGYGLAIDSQGYVWNSSLGQGTIRKFAPNGALVGVYSQGDANAQGCVAGLNDDIWVAHSLYSGSVGHVKNDGTFVGNVSVPGGPTGVAVDSDGFIWATCYNTGVAMKIDPNQGPIGADGVTPVGQVVYTTPYLGGNLYNYSDMTGSTLVGAPKMGSWSVVYDSGINNAKWGKVDWNSLITGDGTINVTVSSSNDGTTYSSVVAVNNGYVPSVPDGQYLKINVNFKRATTGESPVLYDITARTSDITPPTITGSATPAPNANGWNNSDVTVHFDATDTGSGLKSVTPDTVLSNEGSGLSVTGTAEDNAGNTASATVGPINIDKTAPVVVVNSPTASYGTNDSFTVDFSATDALSGISITTATFNGAPVIQGQVISLASLAGNNTFVVTATDLADNSTTVTVNIKVTIAATIDVKPETLNLKSKSDQNAITVLVGFPSEYSVGNMDLSTVTLLVNGVSVPAQLLPTADGMIKFDRELVIAALNGTTGDITMTMNGCLLDGKPFTGFDIVRVINPGK